MRKALCNFCLQNLFIHSLSEFSASFELSYLLSSNLNLLLSSGVDTLTSGFLNYVERTETYELNLVTLLQSTLYSLDSSVKSLLSINFGQTSTK